MAGLGHRCIPADAAGAAAVAAASEPAFRRCGEIASDDPTDRAGAASGGPTATSSGAWAVGSTGPADLVLRPTEEQGEVEGAGVGERGAGVPLVPFGGGSSVVGGVEPRGLDAPVGLDLGAARRAGRGGRGSRVRSGCGAGTLGPAAEAALKPHGLTLRFYPQSFERSSVGGWVATRAPATSPPG